MRSYKSSYHPPHTFRGIVKSQILRFHRICSKREDFNNATRILFKSLRRRGYSRSFLRRVYRDTLSNLCTPSAREDDKGTPLDPNAIGDEVERDSLLPFVSTFHESYKPFLAGVQQNLGDMKTRGRVFEVRLIKAFRKNPSLGDLLVRAKLGGGGKENHLMHSSAF